MGPTRAEGVGGSALDRHLGALCGHVYDLSGVSPIDPHASALDLPAHYRLRQAGALGHQLDELSIGLPACGEARRRAWQVRRGRGHVLEPVAGEERRRHPAAPGGLPQAGA